jgi:hypothetical protein
MEARKGKGESEVVQESYRVFSQLRDTKSEVATEVLPVENSTLNTVDEMRP